MTKVTAILALSGKFSKNIILKVYCSFVVRGLVHWFNSAPPVSGIILATHTVENGR